MLIEIRAHKKFRSRINRVRLKRAAARAWNAENKRRAASPRRGGTRPRSAQAKPELTIYVTTDSEICLLNRKFHATNSATDVLSFSSSNSDYLGDIVISYDRAGVQARAAKWHIGDELDLLVVHGVLHLVGYDDSTQRARKQMWQRQAEILGKIQDSGESLDAG